MKRCRICKAEKSPDDFHNSKNRPDGRHPDCKDCRRTDRLPKPPPTHKKCSGCREIKPVGEFHLANASQSHHKRQAYCKPCTAEIGRQRRLADPDYSRRITERGYFRAYRWRRIEQRYGLTRANYDALFDAQDGICAICGGTNNGKHLVVDHDHKTGDVRGLLCGGCNNALGYIDKPDWLESAQWYLAARWPAGVEHD